MIEPRRLPRLLAACAAALLMSGAVAAWAQTRDELRPPGDYIVAIVNSELVTAGEVEQRMQRVKQDAARTGARLPPDAVLRQQVTDALIDERVLVTNARDIGVKIDPAEVDRAIANIAAQNKIPLDQLRDRLQREGIDYGRFRDNLRDQIAVERVREHDVVARIQPTDREIDALIDQQRAAAGVSIEYDIAQVLVTVPDGANDAVVAERKARAELSLSRTTVAQLRKEQLVSDAKVQQLTTETGEQKAQLDTATTTMKELEAKLAAAESRLDELEEEHQKSAASLIAEFHASGHCRIQAGIQEETPQ